MGYNLRPQTLKSYKVPIDAAVFIVIICENLQIIYSISSNQLLEGYNFYYVGYYFVFSLLPNNKNGFSAYPEPGRLSQVIMAKIGAYVKLQCPVTDTHVDSIRWYKVVTIILFLCAYFGVKPLLTYHKRE